MSAWAGLLFAGAVVLTVLALTGVFFGLVILACHLAREDWKR